MNEVRALNRDAAKQQPESVFENPLEIENLLTKGEKLATLNGGGGASRRVEASNEGMATRGYASELLTVLEEIQEAKARLKSRRGTPTEEGSALLRWKEIL